MQYAISIVINLPRAKVLELFDSHENLKKWQKGLISYEQLSGTPGKVGATSLLTYKNGMKLKETITTVDLPREFSGTYEMKGVWNGIRNYFEETDAQRTTWTIDCTFTMQSRLMKILATLMPWLFRAQTRSLMKAFKDFAENGTDVNAR